MTVSLVISTISQYKLYHEMNRKIIQKVSILLAAETNFRNFAMPKGNIGYIPCEHWSIQWHKNIFWEFWFVKIYFDNFDWRIIILVGNMSGLKKVGWKYSLCSSKIIFRCLNPTWSPTHFEFFYIGCFCLRFSDLTRNSYNWEFLFCFILFYFILSIIFILDLGIEFFYFI